MLFPLWSTKVCINTAICDIKKLLDLPELDSVTRESLKLELTMLTNVRLRLSQLDKWLELVDKDKNIE